MPRRRYARRTMTRRRRSPSPEAVAPAEPGVDGDSSVLSWRLTLWLLLPAAVVTLLVLLFFLRRRDRQWLHQ